MSDRLQELLRQRAMVNEHLAWLDREIAAIHDVPALPTATSASIKPAATGSAMPATKASAATPAANADAEKILVQYQEDAMTEASRARRGLWLLFVTGLGLIALGYYLYGLRLGRWW